mmetsp:Transcript_14828/g.16777  ORF Transcript_14828/g.16777 Transcript_14828/m.16777 type:complete len:85 (-) Transcript_14828:253-507(-)
MVRVHSGVQKKVLALYRKALQTAISKGPENRQQNVEFVRNEFRKHADLKRKDFRTIEYLIRNGEKQIKLMSMPGVSTVKTFKPR